MSRRETLQRHVLIVSILRKHPASFSEVSKILERESELNGYNFNISKRTFQRDCQDISSLYNIEIVYDNSLRAYCIKYDDHSELSERMLETFDTLNALKLGSTLSEYIQFDTRRPKGTENLYGLIHSIKNRLVISFTYERFTDSGPFIRRVEPYALKEFKNRWYLIGKDKKNGNIRTYGLDRLEELEITKQKFQYPEGFSHEQHFRYSFGIIIPDDIKPEEVILSFDSMASKYIKSMPLHNSQKILMDSENELIVSLNLCVTFDLVVEILSYAEHVKVIQPQSLTDQVVNSLKNSISMYSDTN
ncbi:MAG: helix-turn-helix transcriptional regulator [Bacteroidales bacterium]